MSHQKGPTPAAAIRQQTQCQKPFNRLLAWWQCYHWSLQAEDLCTIWISSPSVAFSSLKLPHLQTAGCLRCQIDSILMGLTSSALPLANGCPLACKAMKHWEQYHAACRKLMVCSALPCLACSAVPALPHTSSSPGGLPKMPGLQDFQVGVPFYSYSCKTLPT